MLLKNFLPADEVREYVRFYRIVHFTYGSMEKLPFKAFPPKPEHCLYFYPFEGETIEYANGSKKISVPPVTLIGQQLSASKRCSLGGSMLIFQIMFQPTGLHRLTGIPSYELNDEFLDAEDIFSKEIRSINEQLYHAQNYSEMIEIANRFVGDLICRKVKAQHLVDVVSNLLLTVDEKFPLGKLAREACLGAKQFERKFKERTGVTPKLFAKIIRFDRAFCMRLRYPKMRWNQIAYTCDYSDYQHLVKDYKEFTGLTPPEFDRLHDNAAEKAFGLADDFYQSNKVGSLG
jgi:AraC-like DNA-binding protein